MLFQSEVLDRRSGELVRVCHGDWITVTELGQAFNLGPRQVRQVLHQMGWVFPTAAGRGRYRLTPEAIKQRLGRHIAKSKSGRAFDIISPLGQERFAEALPAALSALENRETPKVADARAALAAFKERRLDCDRWTTPMEVSWLRYFWPDLSQDEIATVLAISKQLVSHHAGKLKAPSQAAPAGQP